jgi:3-phenylpropionate/trans-cinnamate dioxygenase ferredoxin reductase subunit
MEYRGYTTNVDDVVYRGDPESGEYLAFWLEAGRVMAGMNVNVWDFGDDIEALVRAASLVDRDRLADPDTPLAELV